MTAITDRAIGYIIIVVAVLLSHMDKSPVAKINPRTMRSSFVVPIIDLDENQINLDLSNLPTGLFILRMSYPESSSYYKIVKI